MPVWYKKITRHLCTLQLSCIEVKPGFLSSFQLTSLSFQSRPDKSVLYSFFLRESMNSHSFSKDFVLMKVLRGSRTGIPGVRVNPITRLPVTILIVALSSALFDTTWVTGPAFKSCGGWCQQNSRFLKLFNNQSRLKSLTIFRVTKFSYDNTYERWLCVDQGLLNSRGARGGSWWLLLQVQAVCLLCAFVTQPNYKPPKFVFCCGVWWATKKCGIICVKVWSCIYTPNFAYFNKDIPTRIIINRYSFELLFDK